MTRKQEDEMPVVDFDAGLDATEFEATSFGIGDVDLLRPVSEDDPRAKARRLPPKQGRD